jgi:hypothetical protein
MDWDVLTQQLTQGQTMTKIASHDYPTVSLQPLGSLRQHVSREFAQFAPKAKLRALRVPLTQS